MTRDQLIAIYRQEKAELQSRCAELEAKVSLLEAARDFDGDADWWEGDHPILRLAKDNDRLNAELEAAADMAVERIAWLDAKVERLEAEIAALREQKTMLEAQYYAKEQLIAVQDSVLKKHGLELEATLAIMAAADAMEAERLRKAPQQPEQGGE